MTTQQRWTSWLFLTASLAITVAVSRAETLVITAGDGLQGADSYIRQGTATQNYGADGNLIVKDAPTSQVPNSTTRKPYLRFDLGALGNGRTVSATLELVIETDNGGGSPQDPLPKPFIIRVYGIPDGHAGESWVEGNGGTDNIPTGELTWNNAPLNSTTDATSMAPAATYLGSFDLTTDDGVGSTVSFAGAALTEFINADTDGRVTLMLTRVSTSGNYNLAFYSAENAASHPPTLRIETESRYLTPRADAYIQLGTPTANYGNAHDVTVKNSGTGATTRKGYISFDIPATPGWDLVSAELLSTVTLNNGGGGDPAPKDFDVAVWGLKDSLGADGWIEGNGGTDNSPVGEITWNNAPANDTADNDILTAQADQLGSFHVADTDTTGATVSFADAALAEFIAADTDGQVTFIYQRLTANGSWNLVFASKESPSYAPVTLRLSLAPATGTMFTVR